MKRYIKSAANESRTGDFEIKNGVLIKYRGASKNVVVPDGVKLIGQYAFKDSDVEYVKLPDSLTKIGQYAFLHAEDLVSIKLPKNVSIIEEGAFRRCDNLRDVQLNEGLTKIGFWCFSGCRSLKNLDIPQTVKKIGKDAFEWAGIETITMPNIKVPSDLFDECPNLKSINGKDPDLYSFKEDKMTFDDWYMSSDGDIDSDKFAERLENLVRTEFDVSHYFEEPSIQGYSGNDYVDIELRDGSKYSFAFSWSDMQDNIYSDGPEAAAKHYFNEIKEGIESGSALVEDTPTL